MKRRTRLYAAVAVAALFVAGCSGPCSKLKSITAPSGESADFRVYAAMGTSIAAGFESDGLVFRHQERSYAALFAHQVGAAYTYPAISDSGMTFTTTGIKALLRLSSLVGPVIVRGQHPGSPTNLALPTAYTNLGVPGALLANAADSSLYPLNPWFQVIQRGRGTILQQVVSLSPTFVSFEYGANEVLGPALAGKGTPLIDVATFRGLLGLTLDALQAQLPRAKLALFTVPDVITIPFVTTIKPYLVNPANGSHIPLIGPGGVLLSENDFVLLPAAALLAAGTGIPPAAGGNGNPLPDSLVLSAAEAASIRAAEDGYTAAILSEASARGAAVVDLHGLLTEAATTGIDIKGVRYTNAFLTGGLFSLDGVHPTDLGQGLIANRMIDAVNAKFGAGIAHVDLSEAATASSSRLRPAKVEAGPGGFRMEDLEGLRSLFPRR